MNSETWTTPPPDNTEGPNHFTWVDLDSIWLYKIYKHMFCLSRSIG